MTTALLILACWLCLSFLAGAWLALAGYRLHRKQENNRFAWDKPPRYIELDASQWERVQ